MKLLLILTGFFTFDLNGYLGIGIPAGESRTLLKGGGTVGLEATIYERQFFSAGTSLEGSSFVLSGSGNSEFKLMTIAPTIFATTPFLKNNFILKGKILLTRFQIQNPAYTSLIHYITGFNVGADVKIIEKPLKLYLFANYSTYKGIEKDFSFYNLGFALRL